MTLLDGPRPGSTEVTVWTLEMRSPDELRPAGPPELAARNPNHVGGDIACGAASGLQLLLRPKPTLFPYATPHPAVFICSSATPPGPGVHGMSGHNAAKAVWRRLRSAR